MDKLTIASGVLNVILFLLLLFKSSLNDILKKCWEQRQQRLKTLNELRKKRYDLLYVPMYALFTTRHITSSKVIYRPYFTIRFRNFLWQIKKHRVRYAFKVLFEKQIEEGAEVEFGGDFPFNEIRQIISSNITYADEKLLNLSGWADRSRYENETDLFGLTNEEFVLYRHIVSTFSKLNRSFFN